MEKITITKQEFEEFIPVATSPANQTGVYDNVKKGFDDAYDTIAHCFLGGHISSHLDTQNDELKTMVKAMVSIAAFVNMFRQLDLVLTPTGFGIVSNNNVAPASKERVDALYIDLLRQQDIKIEKLIDCLRGIAGWSETPQALSSINCLFWRRSYMESVLGIANPTHKEWISTRLQAKGIENDILVRRISYEQLNELIVATRSNNLSALQEELVSKIMLYINYSINDVKPAAKSALDDIVNFLNKKSSDFPRYRNSTAYMLNNDRGYQNAKQDPTFYFK